MMLILVLLLYLLTEGNLNVKLAFFMIFLHEWDFLQDLWCCISLWGRWWNPFRQVKPVSLHTPFICTELLYRKCIKIPHICYIPISDCRRHNFSLIRIALDSILIPIIIIIIFIDIIIIIIVTIIIIIRIAVDFDPWLTSAVIGYFFNRFWFSTSSSFLCTLITCKQDDHIHMLKQETYDGNCNDDNL